MSGICSECGTEHELVMEWRGAKLPKPQCVCCANDTVRKMIKNHELNDPFDGPRA